MKIKANDSPAIISLILSFYNDERYVASCLQSLVAQDLNSLEIICLFDKGSTDQTYEELMKFEYDPRVTIYEIEHVDRSTARNIGFSKSKGGIVVFCETDAIYHPNFLSTIYQMIMNGYDMIHPIGDGLNVANTLTTLLDAEILTRNRKMKQGILKPRSAWAFKRQILEETSGFKEKVEIAEDRELWSRASRLGYTTGITPHEVWSHHLTESWIQFVKRSFKHGTGRQVFINTYGLSRRNKIQLFLTLLVTILIPCFVWLQRQLLLPIAVGLTSIFLLLYLMMTIRARYSFELKLDWRVLAKYPLLQLTRNIFFSYGLLICVLSLYLHRLRRKIRKSSNFK